MRRVIRDYVAAAIDRARPDLERYVGLSTRSACFATRLLQKRVREAAAVEKNDSPKSDVRHTGGCGARERLPGVRRSGAACRQSLAVPAVAAARIEVTGSLARGELSPPFSDLDLALVASAGAGPAARDGLPEIARSVDRELFAILVDPLHPEACFCSIYRGPFKVDWWVYEEDEAGDQTLIWRGNKPPPYDWASHSWDWLWWLWGKARRGKGDIVRHELPRLWHFLTMNGVDPRRFPAAVPKNATSRELLPLIRRTVYLLPDQGEALGREIRLAVEGDEERK